MNQGSIKNSEPSDIATIKQTGLCQQQKVNKAESCWEQQKADQHTEPATALPQDHVMNSIPTTSFRFLAMNPSWPASDQAHSWNSSHKEWPVFFCHHRDGFRNRHFLRQKHHKDRMKRSKKSILWFDSNQNWCHYEALCWIETRLIPAGVLYGVGTRIQRYMFSSP